jgi:hypothetical protein
LDEHPFIGLVESFNEPPDKYIIEYKIRGIESVGDEIKFIDHHLVEISLPKNYPYEMPICRMKTKIFHPNIDTHTICIADYWVASESLVSLVIRIGEIIAYQSYYIKSPLDAVAAKWTEENINVFPIDSIDLTPYTNPADIDVVLPKELFEPEVPVEPEVTSCPNCQNSLDKENTVVCKNGHTVCNDCTIKCGGCSKIVCLKCNLVKCNKCKKHYCENCVYKCSVCKKNYCSDHIDSELGICVTCIDKESKSANNSSQGRTNFCSACGFPNEDFVRFCVNCGKRMFS